MKPQTVNTSLSATMQKYHSIQLFNIMRHSLTKTYIPP